MHRREALLASVAIMGEILMQDQKLKAQAMSIISTNVWKPPEDLTVHLGGNGNFQRFHFTDGLETVTFTAQELMAALKEPTR